MFSHSTCPEPFSSCGSFFASAIEGTDEYYFLATVVTYFLWFQKPQRRTSLEGTPFVQIDFYLGFCCFFLLFHIGESGPIVLLLTMKE